jgi:tryptophan synthase beta chain
MFADLPDHNGYFGEFGGRFAPEILMQAMLDLDRAWSHYRDDPDFRNQLRTLLSQHAGRETPLHFAEALTAHAGGARLFLKREDLTSSGSHHINAALGLALLAKKLGLSLLVTETATGLHGIAVAQAAKLLEMECRVFIGAGDARRQLGAVEEIKALGAEVSVVEPEDARLLEANEEANRAALGVMQEGFYVPNSAVGPHPFPAMVRDFQSVIGNEVKQQVLAATGGYPDHLVACMGGGSNALGLFHPFLDTQVAMTCVEAGGDDNSQPSRFTENRPGIYQGTRTLMRQDENGQLLANDSLAIGLQASLLGPELSNLVKEGRVNCAGVSDQDAVAAYQLTRKLESITPALESAHAIACGLELAASLEHDKVVVINLSGKGVKDASQVLEAR